MLIRNLEYVTTFDLWKAFANDPDVKSKGGANIEFMGTIRKVTQETFQAWQQEGVVDITRCLQMTEAFSVLRGVADEPIPDYLRDFALKLSEDFRTRTVAVIPDKWPVRNPA